MEAELKVMHNRVSRLQDDMARVKTRFDKLHGLKANVTPAYLVTPIADVLNILRMIR